MKGFISLVLVFAFVVSLSASALAAGDTGKPASPELVVQTTDVFTTLESRIRRNDSRLTDLFTKSGLKAVFGVDDPAQLNAQVLDFFKLDLYGVSDVRTIGEGSSQHVIAIVSYTGLGVPQPMFVSSTFTLVPLDGQLLIDNIGPAPLTIPDGKTVRKVKLTITDEAFTIKPLLKAADIFYLKATADSDATIGIYRLDGMSYEDAVASGQPLAVEAKIVAFSMPKGKGEFAFVGFAPGEYIVVDKALGFDWATGRSAHFTVK